MADKTTIASSKAKASGPAQAGYYAKDSIRYMPASAKQHLGDSAEKNNGFAKTHTYQPIELPHPVTGKMVPAVKPGTERAITKAEYLRANLIEDIDPDQAKDLIKRGLLIRASDVAEKPEPLPKAEPELVAETDDE